MMKFLLFAGLGSHIASIHILMQAISFRRTHLILASNVNTFYNVELMLLICYLL